MKIPFSLINPIYLNEEKDKPIDKPQKVGK
jgi:hypothetical protein